MTRHGAQAFREAAEARAPARPTIKRTPAKAAGKKRSANDAILHAWFQEYHDLQALQNKHAATVVAAIRKAEKEAASMLRRGKNAEGRPLTDWGRDRLERTKAGLKEAGRAGMREAGKAAAKGAQEVASAADLAIRAAVKRGAPKPLARLMDLDSTPKDLLEVLVRTKITGTAWGARWRRAGEELVTATLQSVTQSVLLGESVVQLSKRIQRNYSGELGRARALTIARTEWQRVQNATQDLWLSSNKDTVAGVQYLATFDERTCPRCLPFDGRTYWHSPPRGGYDFKDRPRLPQHPNDRCSYTPTTRSASDLGWSKAEIAASPILQQLTGEPAEVTEYPDMLRQQSRAFQDSVLGKGRAALWRAGKVQVDDFVDVTRGRVRLLTLDELERRVARRSRSSGRKKR